MKILLFSRDFPGMENSAGVEYIRAFDRAEEETSTDFFLSLMQTAREHSHIFTIYPDMLSLGTADKHFEDIRKDGGDIRLVRTMEEALLQAKRKRRNRVFFPASGFYVSAAAMAATLIKARMDGIQNFRICNDLKSEKALLEGILTQDKSIDGVMLLPQTAMLFGKNKLIELSAKHKVLFASSSIEENEFRNNLKILSGNISQGKNIQHLHPTIRDTENQSVTSVLEEVFVLKDAVWKNYGFIPKSKFRLNEKYKMFDGACNS